MLHKVSRKIMEKETKRFCVAMFSVGHCHPYVVQQIYKQMGACATNNRYLHDNTVILAEKLAKTLPKGLEQTFYTNSA